MTRASGLLSTPRRGWEIRVTTHLQRPRDPNQLARSINSSCGSKLSAMATWSASCGAEVDSIFGFASENDALEVAGLAVRKALILIWISNYAGSALKRFAHSLGCIVNDGFHFGSEKLFSKPPRPENLINDLSDWVCKGKNASSLSDNSPPVSSHRSPNRGDLSCQFAPKASPVNQAIYFVVTFSNRPTTVP